MKLKTTKGKMIKNMNKTEPVIAAELQPPESTQKLRISDCILTD